MRIFIVFIHKYRAFIRTRTSGTYNLDACIYCETVKKIQKNLYIMIENDRKSLYLR